MGTSIFRHFSLAVVVSSLFLSCVAETASAQNRNGYFVGNSLSWDVLNTGGFESIANQAGQNLRISQHVRCNSPLTATIAASMDPNATQTCVPTASSFSSSFDLGQFNNAFQQDFDFLVLQPFFDATLQEEIDSAKYLIDQMQTNQNNANNEVYLYATWSWRKSNASLNSIWNNFDAKLDQEFVPSKSTYQIFQNELASAGYDITLIKAGHAFSAVAEELQNAPLGNLSDSTQLYRDNIHGSNAGRYLASAVAFQTITGQSAMDIGDATDFSQYAINFHGTVANNEASAGLRRIANATAVPEPTSNIVMAILFLSALVFRHSSIFG